MSPLGQAVAGGIRRAGLPLAIAGADIRSTSRLRVVDGVDLVAVAADDSATGLELVVDHCTDSGADWWPGPSNPWRPGPICRPVSEAVAGRERDAYHAALEGARRRCTPAGYRILVLGFADNLFEWLPNDAPGVVPRTDPWPPVSAEAGAGVGLSVRPDPFRRKGWVMVQLEAGGAAGRYEPLSVDGLLGFLHDLEQVAAGRADAARLRSPPLELAAVGRVCAVNCCQNGLGSRRDSAGPEGPAECVNYLLLLSVTCGPER